MLQSSFGSIRSYFQVADDDENGGFVITLMDHGDGEDSPGLNAENGRVLALVNDKIQTGRAICW